MVEYFTQGHTDSSDRISIFESNALFISAVFIALHLNWGYIGLSPTVSIYP